MVHLRIWPYLNPLSHMTTLDKSGEEEERHNMPTRAKFLKTKCMDAIHSASTKYDGLSL